MNIFSIKNTHASWLIISFMVLACLIVSATGIHALRIAPTLFHDGEIVTIRSGIEINKFNTTPVTPTDFWKLPALMWPTEEKQWWAKQEIINQALTGKTDITIGFASDSPTSWQVTTQLGTLSYYEIIKRVGLIHIVCLIYIYSAITVYRRHNSSVGFVCAFFLMSSALYLLALAPIVHRPLFLDTVSLHFLINTFFITSTFQISILHFALIFLKKKHIIYRNLSVIFIFYGYAVAISILYLTKLIALATTLPLFIFWIFVYVVIFMNSLLHVKDPIIKNQILTCFLAPLLLAVFFVIAILLPWQSDEILINNYALFSLMLPFALTLSVDNQRLYMERIQSERESKSEKERIHRELHDTVLNDLASMAIIIEGAGQFIDSDKNKVKERLALLKEKAQDSSSQLRSLLWVIDTRLNNWQDVIGLLRKTGYELFSHPGVEFEFESTGNQLHCIPPSPKIRHTLFQIYREALININKHTHATRVTASLNFGKNMVILIVKDNGAGFNPEDVNLESYGLSNIKRRVAEHGGEAIIKSIKGKESQIIVKLPLDDIKLI